MDNKTKGAWIVHHTNKLDHVSHAPFEFQEITFAGKCGILLSSVGQTGESELTDSRMAALAKAAHINVKLELPAILRELKRQKLISDIDNGVHVLGVSTASVLERTAQIFEESDPSPAAHGSIALSELASDLPVESKRAAEYVSDTCKLPSTTADQLVRDAADIGFVDSEPVSTNSHVLFNGNLFRREESEKLRAISASLKAEDMGKFRDANQLLRAQGCISTSEISKILGAQLFEKLHALGVYDVNTVANDSGKFSYVTRPAAFSKFSKGSIAEDAFDLAKAFVTSLTYGMTGSHSGRGRIRMIEALMKRLIAGAWVGPATAIGQDYKVLEFRGVVELRAERAGMFSMKLLKREVGDLALKVILEGDVSTESLPNLPGASVTQYIAPEVERAVVRKHQSAASRRDVGSILNELRQGKIK